MTEDKTTEIEKLEAAYNNIMESPWAMYIDLSFNEVKEKYKTSDYDSAAEMIRRANISGYRREEAACGNI
jgi:hypothetical protein